ncbi:MAG TPA: heme-binding domain-containing protein [Kofleriaceae bacterium]|jgi:mono/diheme cytochrome c family protein
MRFLKTFAKVLGVLVALFLLMQLVPYGRTHSNPPTTEEPTWDSPRTRELAKRACFDCHSNETRWPWYANVAPMSWVVEMDVNNARHIVNFSEWDKSYPLAAWCGNSVRNGGMPIGKYKLAHPEANLTPDETADLARGLDATIGPAVAPK